MDFLTPDDPRPVHFMGIAGAGMSALALLARRRGMAVSGCDTDPTPASDVVAAGAQVMVGHDPAHVRDARAVVYTAAVAADHPELEAARRAGVPVIRRAKALADVVAGATVVGVAGTHGKTTTTVMITEALEAAGKGPTGLAGGRVAAWAGNARLGGTDLYVVEADEYDRSFLELWPSVAVVNNVEADHLECYGTVSELETAFAAYAGRAPQVLAGADDAGARRVAALVGVRAQLVGQARDAALRIGRVQADADGSRAELTLPDGRTCLLRLTVPGLHNVRNAAMAVGVAAALNVPLDPVLGALAAFGGVGRRFEVLGEAGGVVVVDDYAHHPTEVAATLAAARQRYPRGRLVAVFQPHLYSRTAAMGDALGIALGVADVAVVTEVYAARERPQPGVSGRAVLEAASRAGAETVWVPARADIAGELARRVRPGDVVLTLGAGDVTLVGRELLAALRSRAA
jgi:UDP-N-acetylmuramate--alanine ligase